MTEHGLNELFEAVGALRAGQDAMRREMAEQDGRATRHRERVDGKLEILVSRTDKVEDVIEGHTKTLRVIQPTIDEVRMWKQRGIGALAIVGIGASAIAYIVGRLWDAWFSGLWT
ncbi:MAG: DUF1515 family protein [Phycisphaeraceae bacterium]